MTIRATVRPGHAAALAAWLTEVDTSGRRSEVFPFEQLPVHFARFVVLDDDTDLDGKALPASLIFLSDVDGSSNEYIDRVVQAARRGLDEAFRHCEGYPSRPTDRQRVAYLRSHRVKTDANYVNTVGRSVQQVHDEARLRDAIEDFLDRPDHQWTDQREDGVRQAVHDFVAGEPGLAWALRPARRPWFGWRLNELLHLAATAFVLLAILPIVLLVAPVWLVAIRLAEMKDKQYEGRPDPVERRALADREDWAVQNQFSAVGYLKPGAVRRVTVTVVLLGINLSARFVFNKGTLAGVRTIHFARWVFLDNNARLIFCSNYDGSLENYMDDFIDKIAWSLNAAFSNGVGYPKTKWLILGGAKDEERFKNFLRYRQVPTQVWYSAYPDLSAATVANNAAIRAGLARGDKAEPAWAWVRRL